MNHAASPNPPRGVPDVWAGDRGLGMALFPPLTYTVSGGCIDWSAAPTTADSLHLSSYRTALVYSQSGHLDAQCGVFDATGVRRLVMDEFALHKVLCYAAVIMNADSQRVL